MRLKSTQNTEKTRKEVVKAAKAKFTHRQQLHKGYKVYEVVAIYEHNKWWVIINNYDQNTRYTYSVVDAKPGIASTDLDFDLIKEAEF